MRKAVWVIPAVAGGFYMTVRYFFRFALDRNVKQQFAPLGDSTEYEERIRKGKCWLREHETEMVECQSFDGYRLKGHYYEFPEAENKNFGKADSFISPECAEKNYKACPADKQLVLIDGAEHAMSFLVNKEQYILALNQLFKFS